MRQIAESAWSWVYGLALIVAGVSCGAFGIWRLVDEIPDKGYLITIGQVAPLLFIAIGAPTIGVERIRACKFPALWWTTRPDEVLVERYGPKGTFWKGGSARR